MRVHSCTRLHLRHLHKIAPPPDRSLRGAATCFVACGYTARLPHECRAMAARARSSEVEQVPEQVTEVAATVARVGRGYIAAVVATAAVLVAASWDADGRPAVLVSVQSTVAESSWTSPPPAPVFADSSLLWNDTSSTTSVTSISDVDVPAAAVFEGNNSRLVVVEPPVPSLNGSAAVELNGTWVELTVPSSRPPVEVVWQSPGRGVPTGVLLLSHGCSHSATDWWPPSSSCPRCTGLPEETRIVAAALQRGMLAIAVSSVDRDTMCWHVAHDAPRVLDALEAVLAGANISDAVPRFAMGASSGGAFSALLPTYTQPPHPPWRAVAVQIMGVPPDMLSMAPTTSSSSDGNASTPAPYPPSLWVHMPRDAALGELVSSDLAALHAANVTAEEVQVHPLPVTPRFLTQRIGGLTNETAAAVHVALVGADLLDGAGFLRQDPRRSAWREALAAAGVLDANSTLAGRDTLAPDESALAEVLNLAYAVHEICGTPEVTDRMLDFFSESVTGAY